MRGPRGRLLTGGLVVLLVLVAGSSASAESASYPDPDDVPPGNRLDIETLSHSDDATTITYEVKTYEPFEDRDSFFFWFLETDGEPIDYDDFFVIAFYDATTASLQGGVLNQDFELTGFAEITRPAPDRVRVTYERAAIDHPTGYLYGLLTLFDVNGDGDPDDPGEADIAPQDAPAVHELTPPGGEGVTGTTGVTNTSGEATDVFLQIHAELAQLQEEAQVAERVAQQGETVARSDEVRGEPLPVNGGPIALVAGLGTGSLLGGLGLMVLGNVLQARLPIHWEDRRRQPLRLRRPPSAGGTSRP